MLYTTVLEILLDWKTALALFSAALIYGYFKISKALNYFTERGIPHVPSKFILGSDVNTITGRSVGLSVDKMYKEKKKDKLFGMFMGPKPYLVVRDPEYVYKILTPDFEYFHDRGFHINEKAFPMDAHLFFLNGNKWKMIRMLLTPVFTANKMKYMFPEMSKCSNTLVELLGKMPPGTDVDLRATFRRFATDVIATSAFGLEPESQKNPENEFFKMAKIVFESSFIQSCITFLLFASPKLLGVLKLSIVPRVAHKFFSKLFMQVFEMRRTSGIERRDFVQLLLELKNKNILTLNEDKEDNAKEKIELTDEILAAQSFVFLLAGFETTSECLNYTIFLLSRNKEVQEKARKEVQTVLKNFNGEFSYDSIREMTYLKNCILESTRMYPPIPLLNRTVEKDYTFPDGTVAEKGLNIIIPMYSIQRDPAHYRDPEVYDPDRFNDHQGKGLYMAFGDGPRHCIGERFAMLEVKMVLAKLLNNFYIEESGLTKNPIEFQAAFQLSPSHPLYVKLVKINGQ